MGNFVRHYFKLSLEQAVIKGLSHEMDLAFDDMYC